MSNPFPGVDPYLEGPLWTTVHSNLVEEIARQLAPKLKPKYLALTNQRIVVATPDPIEFGTAQSRLPDVGVYQAQEVGKSTEMSVAAAPLIVDALVPEAMSQQFIEIRDVQERRLVATIEVLSPTNKRGEGLGEYRKKRQELVSGNAHFMEIDLLRIGERFPVIGPLPSVPYFVFLSRSSRRRRLEVWPIAFDQPLPVVPVPLLPGDSDSNLDLQLAYQTIYDLFGYYQAADHSGLPVVSLAADQQAWVIARLQAAGYR